MYFVHMMSFLGHYKEDCNSISKSDFEALLVAVLPVHQLPVKLHEANRTVRAHLWISFARKNYIALAYPSIFKKFMKIKA